MEIGKDKASLIAGTFWARVGDKDIALDLTQKAVPYSIGRL